MAVAGDAGAREARGARRAANMSARWISRAREVWRRKFGEPPTDAAERGKQMRFLASRGFGGDAIRKVVSGGDDE